ncbi:DUF2358 domain-containing protein [Kovacikia minuta CCNUW1]|uniref:DUF2358 domain-containing protein n=1 Tax=Kovacikia minuta TaxID=2931930 RepID=UPI001CC959BB|nr:DUF2358 domain-containing protein [Kovacikia minuta]UBF24865.1 DUF2358 domain-containing protein [Kovacikia minuta CCNUW1]
MAIIDILQSDYARFPFEQTFSIYSEHVFFKDPLSQFRGRGRYQSMIGFIKTFFLNCKMDLHAIRQEGNTIYTEWTLSWNTPLPWKPRISIPGRSELTLNSDGLIDSHIDYWNCSKLDVLKQHFAGLPGLVR